MSGVKAPSGVNIKAHAYQDFQGIDASRDEVGLETGEKQHLITLKNGYCDWRGNIILHPGADKRVTSNNAIIDRVAFYGRGLTTWAQRDGGGITLASEAGHEATEVYPRNAIVTSTVFNHKVVYASRNQPLYMYDGVSWQQGTSTSDPRPSYMAATQRRLAIAGHLGSGSEVLFSRVDDPNVFPLDEDPSSAEVTKAFTLDIRNLMGTADNIKGLGAFETNRLAIFTNDQILVYKTDPDFEKIVIEEKATMRVGTISHNSIVPVNSDLFFCSRDGVRSLRRSEVNGVTIYSVPMSAKIDLLYRQLVREMGDQTERINAVFDHALQQYTVFFPRNDVLSSFLTITLNPTSGGDHKWSTGTFLNARCGASLGGELVYGTSGGLYDMVSVEDMDATIYPTMEVVTPVMWQGSITDYKESRVLIIQAAGQGHMVVDAFDENDRQLASLQFDIEPGSMDDSLSDVPLSNHYDRDFQHRYRGLRLRFTVTGTGLVRIIGFAIGVRRN